MLRSAEVLLVEKSFCAQPPEEYAELFEALDFADFFPDEQVRR